MSEDTITIQVVWDSSGDCGQPPPDRVALPIDVYYDGMTSYGDDAVSTYLSDTYGFLVADWRPA